MEMEMGMGMWMEMVLQALLIAQTIEKHISGFGLNTTLIHFGRRRVVEIVPLAVHQTLHVRRVL